MGVLVVQPVNARTLNCFLRDGMRFESSFPAQVAALDSVARAYLLTANRRPEAWCLTVQPELEVRPEYTAELFELVVEIAELLGLDPELDIRLRSQIEHGSYYVPLRQWLVW